MSTTSVNQNLNNLGGNNTLSVEAHNSIKESKAEARSKVLNFILDQRTFGATADEVAEAFGSSHNHVAPRITELKALNLITDTVLRRGTRSGRSARVVVAAAFAQ